MRCSVIKRKLSSGGVERQFNQEIRSTELILIDKTIKKYFIRQKRISFSSAKDTKIALFT